MKAEAHVWLPIESAPKDGRTVDCRDSDGNEQFCRWKDSEQAWCYDRWRENEDQDEWCEEDTHFYPVEWMSLPPPTTPHPCGSEGKP